MPVENRRPCWGREVPCCRFDFLVFRALSTTYESLLTTYRTSINNLQKSINDLWSIWMQSGNWSQNSREKKIKIISNRVDNAQSIHIMGVVVPFFSSHPSHPRGGLPASEVPHGSWLVVPRPRASHDTSASHRPVHRTYDRIASPQ